jgi:hypothetical protein
MSVIILNQYSGDPHHYKTDYEPAYKIYEENGQYVIIILA